MAIGDSSLETATSDELRKQLNEQTTDLEAAEPEEETAEAVEETLETEEESTEEKPSKEKETPEDTAKEEEKEKLYKIKVEDKEEWIPESKMREYAQKGRFLEKERRRMKEAEKLQKTEQTIPQTFDKAKLNEEFMKELQDDTLGGLYKFYQQARELERQQEKEERRAERQFQAQVESEVPFWKEIKPIYEELRDIGHDKEKAFAMAEADYFKQLYINSIQKGRDEGEKKAELKRKAQLPIGEKRVSETAGQLPSEDEMRKMSSSQLRKYLRVIDTG